MKETKEKELLSIIDDLLWMAARYAHGRHTYAPSMVRGAVATLKRLYPGYEIQQDGTINAPEKDDIGGIGMREDWLDDIFNL